MLYVSIYIYIFFFFQSYYKMQEFVYTPESYIESYICIYTGINSNAFGHRFSSTSHHMSSRAIHLGKNLLSCRSISSNLLLICPGIRHSLSPGVTFDHEVGGHKPSTFMRNRIPLWGWGMTSKVEGKVTSSWDGLQTILWLHESGAMPQCPIQLYTYADFCSLHLFPHLHNSS